MSLKLVVPSFPARRDVQDAVDHYTDEAGLAVADRFIAEVQRVYGLIARTPASGSPRWAHELAMVDLRSHQLRRYPYLVFYIDRDDRIDVLRVLHAQRDIATQLLEPDD